ncbi:MAG: DUF4349 domain-containing protein [Ruminococcus sp.]|nr:DUF4349 domain-containing protein [Ruminococcus sp.]
MKKYSMLKLASLLLVILILAFSLVSCGAQKESIGNSKYDYITEDSLTEVNNGSVSDSSLNSESDTESAQLNSTRKIIETIYYSVETKTFDDLSSSLEERAKALNGYIESSDVSGNSYDYEGSRFASFVFRIPSDKVEEFTAFVSENATVTNKRLNTEDVTLEYIDVESRISALKAQKDSLEELLSKATSTQEIIDIRDTLTDVIYEIESYQSRLRTMDNLIDFTKITVDIYEVEHTSVVTRQSVWQRIGTNLVDNFRGVFNFIVEFFVFLVSAIPYLLFIGIVAFVVVIIVKASINKRRKKREKNKENNNENKID